MKKKGIFILLAAACLLTGCGSEEKKQYEQAVTDLSKGYYEKALEGFSQAISNDIHVVEAWRGEGIALLKLARYEEAVQAFETALAQEDGSKALRRDILLYKADAEFKSGQAEAALQSASQALEISADGQCYLFIGKLQLEVNQYDQAKESFQNVLKEDASYERYLDIYQIYRQKDMHADGEEYLKLALEHAEEHEDAAYQRGRIYYFMGDIQKSKQELTEASNDGSLDAMLFLGKVYLSESDPARARVMYQQYIDGQENPARGYNGLALCDISEAQYDSALEHIQKGLTTASTEEAMELLYNEVVVYEKKLDFETANAKIKEYLERYPDDETARREALFLENR